MVLKKGKRSLYKKLEEKGDHFQVHFFIFQKLSASANKIILLFFFFYFKRPHFTAGFMIKKLSSF